MGHCEIWIVNVVGANARTLAKLLADVPDWLGEYIAGLFRYLYGAHLQPTQLIEKFCFAAGQPGFGMSMRRQGFADQVPELVCDLFLHQSDGYHLLAIVTPEVSHYLQPILRAQYEGSGTVEQYCHPT